MHNQKEHNISDDKELKSHLPNIYAVVTWQYVVVTGPLRGLCDAFWIVERNLKMSIYCRVSYVAVTRIPSLVIIWRRKFDFTNLSYVAHTRQLYAKV